MNRIEFYSKLDKYKADKANEEKEQNGGSLSHYGIPKMKWGQRRWQNADGTFNEEGKQRYFGKGKKLGSTADQKIGATGIYDIAAGVISIKKAINNYGDVQALRKEYGDFMKNSDQNYSDDERLSVLNNKKKIAKMQNALEFGDEKAYNKLLGKVKSKDKEAVEKFLKDLNDKTNKNMKPDEETAKKLEDSVKYLQDIPLNERYDDDDSDNPHYYDNNVDAAYEDWQSGDNRFNVAMSIVEQTSKYPNTYEGTLYVDGKDTPIRDVLERNLDIINEMVDAMKKDDKEAWNEARYKFKTQEESDLAENFVDDMRNAGIIDQKVGSISKPKVSRSLKNADGTLNERGKTRVATSKKASDVASSVFLALRNFKLFELASLPVAGAALALSGFGVPAVLATALAGAIVAPSAAIDNTLYKKLEKRADAYYDMLNK